MPQDYLYDVFISYRHKQPVLDWVVNHFHPLLEQWLPNFMPVDHEISIFLDTKIETGSEWPAKLHQALKMSRCLLSVWSPEYFRSNWCQAELQTIRQREQLIGLRTDENPSGLIYAVVFAGAVYLPQEVRTIQYKDLSNWNHPYPIFRQTAYFVDLDREVQRLCQFLAQMVLGAPAWQDGWPIITPAISSTVSVALPRLQ